MLNFCLNDLEKKLVLNFFIFSWPIVKPPQKFLQMVISYDLLRLYLLILGYPWLYLAIRSYLRPSWDILGCLMLSLAIPGYLWLSLAKFYYIWLFKAISGYLEQSQAISSYLGLSLAISGNVLLYLAIKGYLQK